MHWLLRPFSAERRVALLGAVVVVTSLLAVLAGVAYLSSGARDKIDQLATANTDATVWLLAQFEVEHNKFELAVAEALTQGAPALPKVRRAYDIFYSRAETIRNSPNLRQLLQQPEPAANLRKVLEFRDAYLPLIDGPDAALLDGLPRMKNDLDAIHGAVRQIALAGVEFSAARAQQTREAASSALARLAMLTASLFLALLSAAFGFLVLALIARRQSSQRASALARLASVIETSLDAVIVTDRTGRVLEFNGAAQEIFGYAPEEAAGRTIGELIVPEHLRAAHEAGMKRFLAGGPARMVGAGRIRLEGRNKAGRVFPVELSISQAEGPHGPLLVSFLRDITEQVAAEREIIEARDKAVAGEKAKAKLLAVMSHEMRTPLNGLLGTLELLETTELSRKQRDYTRIMRTSGDVLLTHVNDVLDISRLDAGRYEIARMPYEPGRLLSEIAASQAEAARARGNQITWSVEPGADAVLIGDPARIRQVLVNLVGNAIKFTRAGRIHLEAARDTAAGTIEFRVTDNGIGIPEDKLDTIFEDFVTLDSSFERRAEGTGLGLGIARRMVAAMGGEMGVESEPGDGSVFWFRLPAAPADGESAAVGEAAQETPVESRALNILLVEDNQINRLVAGEMLRKLGHSVTEAHDGREGVAVAVRRRFDVILMDISMPGMDGLEAARAIRSGGGPNADTPIIALTANALPADHDRFVAAGMAATITKPIRMDDLKTRLLRHARTDPAPAEPVSELPAILDEEVLADLRAALGPEAFASQLGLFKEQTDRFLTELAASAQAPLPAETLAQTAHKHAGSAAVFGARRLQSQLAQLENRLKTEGAAPGEEDLAKLHETWRQTLSRLTEFS